MVGQFLNWLFGQGDQRWRSVRGSGDLTPQRLESVGAGQQSVAPYIDPNEVLVAAIRLFSRDPGLLNKLADLCGREEFRQEVPSLFHHLFVGASGPALGTDDVIVGYRSRDSDERHPMFRTSDGNLDNIHAHS